MHEHNELTNDRPTAVCFFPPTARPAWRHGAATNHNTSIAALPRRCHGRAADRTYTVLSCVRGQLLYLEHCATSALLVQELHSSWRPTFATRCVLHKDFSPNHLLMGLCRHVRLLVDQDLLSMEPSARIIRTHITKWTLGHLPWTLMSRCLSGCLIMYYMLWWMSITVQWHVCNRIAYVHNEHELRFHFIQVVACCL